MSDLDTKAIKARLAAGVNTTEALFENVMKSIRGVGIVLPFAQAHVIAASMNDLRHPYEADIAALLAEVERLQRERAEWRDRADALMTEQMTQMRDLTAEVEALRARLTLTPERVEAAAKAAHGRWVLFYEEDVPWEDERESVQKLYRSSQRAALLAAGMEAQP